VGQILLSVLAAQEFVRDRVPYADRLPRLRKYQIRRMMRHRWVRSIDKISGSPEARRRRREARRARRASGARRAEAAGHENPKK